MNKSTVVSCALACALAWFVAPAASAEGVELTSAEPTLSQNFDSMGTLEDLPSGWKIECNTTGPLNIGSYANASAAVQYVGSSESTNRNTSENLPSNAKNGSYNFCSSADATDRAVGGISTGVTPGTRATNLMVMITNEDATKSITELTLSYDVEKYRKGSNASGFEVQVYTSVDGENWAKAGNDLRSLFAKDDATAGAAPVPVDKASVVEKTVEVNVPAGESIYVAWHIAVPAEGACNNAQALAVDNVVIAATFAEPVVDEPVQDIALTADAPSFTENFDSMGTSNVLPYGWRIDRNLTGPTALAAYGSAATEVMYVGCYETGNLESSANMLGNSKNGTYNFGASANTTDRAVGGMTTSIGGGTRATNLMVTFKNNDADKTISALTVSYDIEKYRTGSNANGFAVQLYTSTDGNSWASAGDDFYTFMAPDASTNGASVVPVSTTNVVSKVLYTRVAPGESLYLAWHIAVAAGTDCASAQGLGIDNVAVEATFVAEEAPAATTVTVTPAQTLLVPTLPEKVRVLSLNNSLIDYNDQYQMFNNIATAMDKAASWTKHTNLGQPLSYHYSETGDNSARSVVASQYWSHIILQEHSSLPRTDLATFRNNVAMWVAYIRENCPNPNAVIILPVNWAYNDNNLANFTDHNSQLLANYRAVAAEFGVTLCPVAAAYQLFYDENGSAIADFYSDNRHPTARATYLAACMEYSLIFGEDATDIAFKPGSIDEETAASMRSYAQRALAAFHNPVDHNRRTVDFSAAVRDQYGTLMPDAEVTFTATDGTFSDDTFTAPATEGDITVTATSGVAAGTATVSVVAPVEPAPRVESIVVHGYLNLNFKDRHLTGENDSDNRLISRGAPYTLSLDVDGTAVYTLDYRAASDIEGAPKPQIWMNGFQSMTDEGGGFYSYTFPGTYEEGDAIQFSRYVAGAIDENSKITLISNNPVEVGAPASIALNLSTNTIVSDEWIVFSTTVRDAAGHNINDVPEIIYTATDGVTLHGFKAEIPEKGTGYSLTARIADTEIATSANLMRLTSAGAENLSLNADVTADDAVKNPDKLGNAVDGNTGTQVEWNISSKNEEHFLTVDLGRLCAVEAVTVVWEGASATIYDVNLTKDGVLTDTPTFVVTNGAGGAGLTVTKHFYDDSFKAINARYVTVNTHTVYEAGWGLKLKQITVYGHELAPVDFSVGGVYTEHAADKSVTVNAVINHMDYEEVTSYDVWVVEVGAKTRRQAPAVGETDAEGYPVVGTVSVPVTSETGSTIEVAVPLTGLTLDDEIHNIGVRAKANLSDGSSVASPMWNEGDAEGATGNEYIAVDTSKSNTATGVESFSTDAAEAEYFDLTGRSVARGARGFVIERRGNAVRKVIL